jgi:hypothetical protein
MAIELAPLAVPALLALTVLQAAGMSKVPREHESRFGQLLFWPRCAAQRRSGAG